MSESVARELFFVAASKVGMGGRGKEGREGGRKGGGEGSCWMNLGRERSCSKGVDDEGDQDDVATLSLVRESVLMTSLL